jgi:thioesterase domain-containing protein
MRTFVWKTFETFGIAIPVTMRMSYILNLYRRALRAYAAQPLDANMLLFVSNDFSQNSRSHWGKRSVGTLTIFPVPGNHATVLSDRRSLKTWAEKLRSCLEAAQMRASERLQRHTELP